MGSIDHDSAKQPIVKTKRGAFKGVVLTESAAGKHPIPIESWLGIRYAQPPLKDLRFARPVPLPETDEEIDATKWGFRAPAKQLLVIPGLPEQSEDCLTLNVFRQEGSYSEDGRKLPVYVYLHGGAYNRGTASMANLTGMLAYSTEPFIAVSCNYRIGALGFLNCELTAKAGLLNLGLHDQRLVLEWVHENIGAWGGDVDNVTIGGLSAGAHSAAHHMMNTNESRTLFHRVISESGAATARVVHPARSRLHEAQFKEFLRAVGCPKGLPEDEILPFLRNLPEEVVVEASIMVFDSYNPSIRWAWQPVIDDEIISRRPIDAWRSKVYHKVPILTGYNHNEGQMYVPKSMSKSSEFREFFATLLPQLTSNDLDRLEKLYPDPATDPSSPYVETRDAKHKLDAQYARVEAAYGHYAYVASARETANMGSAVEGQPPIYLYHWAPASSVLGANHGDQMWYETMDEKVRSISSSHEQMATYFHDYICSFIVSGDPNKIAGRSEGRPMWKAFQEGYGEGRCDNMIFGLENDERAGGTSEGVVAEFVDDGWAREETKFWLEVSANRVET